jgi:hypothetical protein
MKRPFLIPIITVLSGLVVSCIGIEHEDIGGSGDEGQTTGTSGTNGDGDGTDGTGDDSGESGETGDDGAKFDVGGDGDGDPLGPLIYVAAEDGALRWSTDNLSDDQAPDAILPTGDSLALAVVQDRLLVASADGQTSLFMYDDAANAADGADEDSGLGVAEFGGAALSAPVELSVDTQGHLWVADGDVRLFEDANGLDGASNFDAHFSDARGAVVSSAHDAAGGKLVGAQDTAGIPVWDDPTADVGSDNAPDWYLQDAGAHRRARAEGGSLYIASAADPFVRAWTDIANTGAPAGPDVTLGAAVNGLASPVHLFTRGDWLVVTDDSNGGRVLIWDTSGLANDQAPAATVGEGTLTSPTKAVLGADGRLYVLDGDALRIFDDAMGNGDLAVTIDSPVTSPDDLLLLECSSQMDCQSGTCTNGLCL